MLKRLIIKNEWLFRKMKSSKLSIKLLLSVLLISIVLPSSVFAYNTYNQHVLINGVGDYGRNSQQYFIDSSASGYATHITNAMNEWIYTTSYWGISTPISFVKTTSMANSRIDLYKVSTTNEWWGLTQHIYQGEWVDADNTNWLYAKVLLDGDFSSLSSTSSNNRQKAVIAHEMGHAMGLAHTSMNTLMRPDIAFCSPGLYRAQPNDLAGINFLY